MNNYYCPKCGDITKRDSNKKWIKSMCAKKQILTRLIMLKSNYRCSNNNSCDVKYRHSETLNLCTGIKCLLYSSCSHKINL